MLQKLLRVRDVMSRGGYDSELRSDASQQTKTNMAGSTTHAPRVVSAELGAMACMHCTCCEP